MAPGRLEVTARPTPSRPAPRLDNYSEPTRALLRALCERKGEGTELGELDGARFVGSRNPEDQRLVAAALRKQAALDSGTSLSAIAQQAVADYLAGGQ